jgi:Kelch motif
MNEWPVDPELDARLRRLMAAELTDARSEAIHAATRPVAARARGRVSFAGVGVLAVTLLVAALALRGTGGGTPAGPDAGASPTQSPSPVPSETAARSGDGGPQASGSAGTDSAFYPCASGPAPQPTAHPGASASATPTARLTGQFVAAGPLAAPNVMSATVLADGRVLLLGDGPTATQVFDPKTNRFNPSGDSAIPVCASTAVLLADGRVLVAGGHNRSTTVATAELFDPTTGKFTPTGSMTQAREGQAMTLLDDGRVLVTGGLEATYGSAAMNEADRRASRVEPLVRGTALGPPGSATAELYDPKTGTFTSAGSMRIERQAPSATRLADGRVLVVGGSGVVGSSDALSAEIYDPRTGAFADTGSTSVPFMSPRSTLLRDGRVLIVGDEVLSVSAPWSGPTMEIYDPSSAKFSGVGPLGGTHTYSDLALLPDGRVLLVGGHLEGSPAAECDLFDPATGSIASAGSLSRVRDYPFAKTLADGRVLIMGYLNGTPAELYVP